MSANVRRYGAGHMRVLALHCTLGHSGNWRRFAAGMPETFQLVAPDLPGHGKNSVWYGDGDYQDVCVSSLLPVFDAPSHLIGHSFGAIVALRLAVEHPELVRSLTLVEPVFFAAAKSEAPEALENHLCEAGPYLEALARGDKAHAARLFNRLWGDGTAWQDFPSAARQYMTDRIDLVAAQAAAIFDDRAGLLNPGTLEKLTIPTLLVRGGKSPSIIETIHSALLKRMPNAHDTTIGDASHMLVMSHAEALSHVYSDFLEMA